jgi:hypothetical protein
MVAGQMGFLRQAQQLLSTRTLLEPSGQRDFGQTFFEQSTHGPALEIPTFWHLAWHSFEYVFPSVPHTGFSNLGHLQTFF